MPKVQLTFHRCEGETNQDCVNAFYKLTRGIATGLDELGDHRQARHFRSQQLTINCTRGACEECVELNRQVAEIHKNLEVKQKTLDRKFREAIKSTIKTTKE